MPPHFFTFVILSPYIIIIMNIAKNLLRLRISVFAVASEVA